MKLKQILSGFMAVAMAVTSSVVFPCTVSATNLTVTGSTISGNYDSQLFISPNEDFKKSPEMASLVINLTTADGPGYSNFVVCNSDWSTKYVDTSNYYANTDYTINLSDHLTDGMIDTAATNGLTIGGAYLTVNSAKLVWTILSEEIATESENTEIVDWNSDAINFTSDAIDAVLDKITNIDDAKIVIKYKSINGHPDPSTQQYTYSQVCLKTNWLNDTLGQKDGSVDTENTCTVEFEASLLEELSNGGLYLCGYNYAFESLTVIETTDTAPVTENAITISNTIENGEVEASAETAVAGTEITLTATPAEGYELDAYTVTDASDNTVTVTDGKFTMPDSAVTVSATFKAIDYTLTAAAADGGSIYFEVDGNRAETANVGDSVYVIIEADDYYNLSSATANGVPVEACLFEMPAENVTVTPVFALDTETLKTDVDAALTAAILKATQSSAYTVANLNTAIVNALAKINEAVALTVDTSKLTLKASTEEATGSITGTVTIKAGNTTITTAAADVTLEKVPTDPVQVAYDAILAYLETVTFDNDFHATNQSKAIEALVAEKAPDARVSPSFTVILATYTDAGSVKGTIQIIADGYEAKTITVDKVIAVLAKTDEMLLEEAVTATEAAIKDITTADGITVAVIEEAIANDDITVTVKSEETKAPTTTATGVQTVTITLTLNELSKTVTKTFDIDKLEEEESIVLWSGSTDLGTDWGTSITVTFDTSKLNAGDTVKVTYKAGTAATYQQIKLMNGDWKVLESPTGKNEWDCVDLSASATTYEFVISEADVKLLNGTMIVSGYNATISSVEVIPAKNETSSSYTDPENTDIPTGKTVTQKTVVEDGIYNQRFIKKVSASELVGATKIVFTVSNGTKTAKYESTKCYSSLNVNGDSLSAGDEYVFLGLTIKGIPENITVTIEGIEIV